MNRRDFCKHMALLTAGAVALPKQIAAFEQLYDVNTKQFGNSKDIISIKDIVLGFDGTSADIATLTTFFHGDRVMQVYPMNARGSFRAAILPDCPMLSTKSQFRWDVESSSGQWGRDHLKGCIRYVDMDGIIHDTPIDGVTRHL